MIRIITSERKIILEFQPYDLNGFVVVHPNVRLIISGSVRGAFLDICENTGSFHIREQSRQRAYCKTTETKSSVLEQDLSVEHYHHLRVLRKKSKHGNDEEIRLAWTPDRLRSTINASSLGHYIMTLPTGFATIALYQKSLCRQDVDSERTKISLCPRVKRAVRKELIQ